MHLEKLVPESALIAEAQDVLAQVDMEVKAAPVPSIAESKLPVIAEVA
jgi:hypothetical protein